MNDKDRAWLILANARIGTDVLAGLLDAYGAVEKVVCLSAGALSKSGVTDEVRAAILNPDEDLLARSLAWLEKAGNRIIRCDS
ncbi:MAG: hypothetical protein V3S54_03520, partial [Woeseiaceae bacterium]